MIPLGIPLESYPEFKKNYDLITKGTNKLFLFAADHKIEHLDKDFAGPTISPQAHKPTHIFDIASQGEIGALATQLGLITRYGQDYSTINFIAKLNSKTNLVPPQEQDPMSRQLWTIDEVLECKYNSNISLCGVGLTIYLGSIYEDLMLKQAAHTIMQAHKYGLVTILWVYPRGRAIKNDQDPVLLAGAAGVANALGADFVKLEYPHTQNLNTYLPMIVEAAGNTKVLCAGGKAADTERFLKDIYEKLTIGNISGVAVGRNIYQHTLDKAITITKALSSLVYTNGSLDAALKLLKK